MKKITKILIGKNSNGMKKITIVLSVVSIMVVGFWMDTNAQEAVVKVVPASSLTTEQRVAEMRELSSDIVELDKKIADTERDIRLLTATGGATADAKLPAFRAQLESLTTVRNDLNQRLTELNNTGASTGTQAPFGGTKSSNQVPFGGKESTQSITASFDNPLEGVDSLSDLFYKIIKFIIGFSYVVIAAFYLIAGFKFVKAQGNPEELSGAKRAFLNTTIGAIIIIGINVITQVIQSIIEGLQN